MRAARPVLLAPVLALLLGGCGALAPGGGAAPEVPPPETTHGTVTALRGGLEEQFSVDLEDLTGSRPASCDEPLACAIQVEEQSPSGTLLVHAWQADPAVDVVARPGQHHRRSAVDARGGRRGRGGGRLAPRPGVRGGRRRRGAADADARPRVRGGYRGARPALGRAPRRGRRHRPRHRAHGGAGGHGRRWGGAPREIEPLGLGTDGTEHWRTSLSPESEAPASSYLLDTVLGDVVVFSGPGHEPEVLARIAPAGGEESPIGMETGEYLDGHHLAFDDLSVTGLVARGSYVSSDEAEPWEPPRSRSLGGVVRPLGVCDGTLVTADPVRDEGGEAQVRGLDARTGQELWAVPVEAGPSGGLCAAGDVLLEDRTTLHLIDGRSGETLDAPRMVETPFEIPEGGGRHGRAARPDPRHDVPPGSRGRHRDRGARARGDAGAHREPVSGDEAQATPRARSIASLASLRPAPVCSRYTLIASMTLPSAMSRRHYSGTRGAPDSSRSRSSSASPTPARSARTPTRTSSRAICSWRFSIVVCCCLVRPNMATTYPAGGPRSLRGRSRERSDAPHRDGAGR
ncbi:hypothetical protein [Brachybacterium sp. GPGPB12]|uniref:hypothetical protein n=1 Tax=Brachybacterium sp. GPGPB12 TaxID=3023517 RepID=UPI0031343349